MHARGEPARAGADDGHPLRRIAIHPRRPLPVRAVSGTAISCVFIYIGAGHVRQISVPGFDVSFWVDLAWVAAETARTLGDANLRSDALLIGSVRTRTDAQQQHEAIV